VAVILIDSCVITDLAGDTIDHVVAGLDRTVPLLASAHEKLHMVVLDILSGKNHS
jgi:hypothetical protein